MTSTRCFQFISILILSAFLTSCSAQLSVTATLSPTRVEALPTSSGTPMPPTVEPSSTPSLIRPPSNWIAFLNQNNIWLIHPDGSGLTQITKNVTGNRKVSHLKWSPDGNTLAYSMHSTDGDSALFLYNLQTSDTKMVVKDDVGESFDWSSTGKQIIFDTAMIGTSPGDQHNKGLRVYNLETGKVKLLVRSTESYTSLIDPQWSSEESHVLFSEPAFYEPRAYFGVAELASGKLITLPVSGQSGSCEWFPNDLRILCNREVPNNDGPYGEAPHEVAILDENGNEINTFPLVKSKSSNFWSKISPEGTTVAIGYIPTNDSQIQLLSLETGKFTDLGPGAPLDWSPDGHWIVAWDAAYSWQTADARQLFVINIDTGRTSVLSEFDGFIADWQP